MTADKAIRQSSTNILVRLFNGIVDGQMESSLKMRHVHAMDFIAILKRAFNKMHMMTMRKDDLNRVRF